MTQTGARWNGTKLMIRIARNGERRIIFSTGLTIFTDLSPLMLQLVIKTIFANVTLQKKRTH